MALPLTSHTSQLHELLDALQWTATRQPATGQEPGSRTSWNPRLLEFDTVLCRSWLCLPRDPTTHHGSPIRFGHVPAFIGRRLSHTSILPALEDTEHIERQAINCRT